MYIFHREFPPGGVLHVENSTAETTLFSLDLIGENRFGPNNAFRLHVFGGFYVESHLVNPSVNFKTDFRETTCSGLGEGINNFDQGVGLPEQDVWFRLMCDFVFHTEGDCLFAQTCQVGYANNIEDPSNTYGNRLYTFSSSGLGLSAITDLNIKITAALSVDEYLSIDYRGMYAEYL